MVGQREAERRNEGESGCPGRRAIDIHTHLYPTALARKAMKVAGREDDPWEKLPLKENLLARMREEQISVSVVLHVVSRPRTQTDVNRFAGELQRSNLLCFGGLHPDCGNPIEELERIKDLRMAGVKFHPPFQAVRLADEKYREIWRRINHLGLPVLIHCGEARMAHTYDFFPSDAGKIVRYLPDVPVILAHMGGRSEDPREEEILFSLPENVAVDTAMSAERQTPADFMRIAGRMGPERVLMGSDFPYGGQAAAIRFIEESGFSGPEKQKMLYGNAKRLLFGAEGSGR